MSTVYRAADQRNQGAPVAVKEFNAARLSTAERAEALAWLAREAALLSTLDNPHLPRLLAAFSEGDRHYVAMPFLTGETMEERIARVGPQPEILVLAWGRELAGLLRYLHSQDPPVVHRDLKPANVLLRPDGSLILLDLGVARAIQTKGTGAAIAGTAVGTPGYAPPEQYQGMADERSDLYALGATLHRALTGYDPARAQPFRHPAVRSLAPSVSEETERLIGRLLQVAPEQRPAGAMTVMSPLSGAMRRACARAYQPVHQMYYQVLGLLAVAVALGGLLYQLCYGLPLTSSVTVSFQLYKPVADPLRVLLVFAPGVLPFLPLLNPRLRVLSRTLPPVVLRRDWVFKLLLCCWILPAAAWLVNLYRQRWGNLTAPPGQHALLLALGCELAAMAGIVVLRYGPEWLPLQAAAFRRHDLVLGGLIMVWPASAIAHSPAALNLCYVAPMSDSMSLGNWTPMLAVDQRGDIYMLDQYGLRERMVNGAIHVLLTGDALATQGTTKALSLMAVSPTGTVILGSPGSPSLYRVTHSSTVQPWVPTQVPGLPDHTSLAAGADGSIYYSSTSGGMVWTMHAGQTAPTPLQPHPRLPNWQPQALATDRQGNLYVMDTGIEAIERVDTAGRLRILAHVQTPGFGDSSQVTLLAEPDGTLYTADGTTLLKVMPDGKVDTIDDSDGISQAVAVPQQHPVTSRATPGDMTTPDGAAISGTYCLLDH